MSVAGALGSRFGLAPAAVAGLAGIAGEPAPPPDAQAEDWNPANPYAPNNAGKQVVGPGTNVILGSGVGAGPPQPEPANDTAPEGASNDTAPQPARVDPYEQIGAAGPSARTVPAHWQPGSHAVSLQRGMAPEELERGEYYRDVAEDHGLAAADKQLEAARQNGMADAIYSSAHAMMAERTNAQLENLKRQRDAYVADEHKKFEQLAAAAQKEVDPNAYFKERGTGAQLATALMIGLNEFAVLWRGRGTNTAKSIIDDAINRNIDAQKTNIANARGALAARETAYARNLAAFGDAERTTLATKVNYLDQVAAQLDAHRAGAKNDQAEAGYNDLVQKLNADRAQAADRFSQLTHTQANETMNEHFVPAQTVGGPAAVKREGNLVTLSDGTTYVMPSEKTAETSIAKIQNLDMLQRRNNQILQLRDQASRLDPILDRTEYQKKLALLKELADEKVSLMSIGLGQGTVREGEYERAKEFAANAENGLGFFKGNPIAKAQRESADYVLRAQTKKWADDQRAFVTSAGGAIYQRGYARDQAGNLKPTGRYTGQDATPTEELPPEGSKPMNSRTELPTAPAPLRTRTPMAPRFDLQGGRRGGT